MSKNTATAPGTPVLSPEQEAKQENLRKAEQAEWNRRKADRAAAKAAKKQAEAEAATEAAKPVDPATMKANDRIAAMKAEVAAVKAWDGTGDRPATPVTDWKNAQDAEKAPKAKPARVKAEKAPKEPTPKREAAGLPPSTTRTATKTAMWAIPSCVFYVVQADGSRRYLAGALNRIRSLAHIVAKDVQAGAFRTQVQTAAGVTDLEHGGAWEVTLYGHTFGADPSREG